MGQEQPAPRPITILICDDNAAMRALLRVVLERAPGMRVVGEAADGEAAIHETTRLQPEVILLDLAMPALSGFEALPWLRLIGGAAKIIVLTGFSEATVADQVLELGADSYLEKGVSPETIIAAIEDVVADTTTLVHAQGVREKFAA